MPNRRDLIKGAIAGATSIGMSHGAKAQNTDEFTKSLATFDKNNQEKLPAWAFSSELKVSPTIRPKFLGQFEAVDGNAIFGPSDLNPVGKVFHGVAKEWEVSPSFWQNYGCDITLEGKGAWDSRKACFGKIFSVNQLALPPSRRGKPVISNWGHFPIKCYKLPAIETQIKLRPDAAFPARVFAYGGFVPGPTFKMRIGQPSVVRLENHLDTEISMHLHGGHVPSHADGFPTFYTLPDKSRDYFYPNILPMRLQDDQGNYVPDVAEAQSTMWYHDHGMDVTAVNVVKGLAGFSICYSEQELHLIKTGLLPGLGADSCLDPEEQNLADNVEDPENPGFYKNELGKEPFYNPFDIPIVVQDKVIDLNTGQVVYNNDAHNGYLGNTFFVNGTAWPHKNVWNRKYRFRILNGSNSRFYRFRILSEADFLRSQQNGLKPDELELAAKPFIQIGKDAWLWSKALERKAVLLSSANRADVVIDFGKLAQTVQTAGPKVFYLVNTMPQFDGRGPKGKLQDPTDPRVLPLPFDVLGQHKLQELDKPIAIMKFIVSENQPPEISKYPDAKVVPGSNLIAPRPRITDDEIEVVREFIFERGNGAWLINGRFYDPTIANAAPQLGSAEEWVLRNGGGGWWHPIHIHLEAHQLVGYEKDFAADALVDLPETPARRALRQPIDVTNAIPDVELIANHDTTILGPNTTARIRMRFRTFPGPFVFHCHNIEHEDMRMMFNFEAVDRPDHDPEVVPTARTHGNDVTLNGKKSPEQSGYIGELTWDQFPVPKTPVDESGRNLIDPRQP